MRALVVVFVMLAGIFAQAQSQPELPLEHPDQTLLDAFLGETNVRRIEFSTLPTVVADTFSEIDVAAEMADGYYDLQASAMYEVTEPSNARKVVGYMSANVLSYTQDDDYSLALIYVNPEGRLVNPDWVRESAPYTAEEIARDFPPELQLPETEN
ncbi:MAG: hypothetical protein V4760_18260 [Bdellovibrionota bacterium]